MKKTPFGRTNLQVTSLGFGSAPIGYLKTDFERASRIMNLLLDRGVNLIDTAASYPGSEAAIARAVGHRRSEFVLVSKCGSKVSGASGSPWSAELIGQTVDRSLANLKTDVLDVMLLHSCDLGTLRKGEALGALARAREAGKIRFAGYSGDNDAAAYAATLPDIAVVQTSVNLTDQANIDQVLPAAQANGLGVMAKRPIANAAWRQAGEQPGMYAGYAATYMDRFRQMKLTLADLGFGAAADAGRAWPEAALRFTLSQPGVHVAIIGTTSPENALANLSAAEKGPLPAAAVERVRAAFRRAESEAGETWAGQT